MRFLYFNQIFHIIFPPSSFTVYFYDPKHHRMFFCRKSHYFLMHGYLLMYCVYNTLCISLHWWIHLHPLENKNSLKGQSHNSLSMLPKYCASDVFLVFCGFIVVFLRGRKGSVLICWGDLSTSRQRSLFIFWMLTCVCCGRDYQKRQSYLSCVLIKMLWPVLSYCERGKLLPHHSDAYTVVLQWQVSIAKY